MIAEKLVHAHVQALQMLSPEVVTGADGVERKNYVWASVRDQDTTLQNSADRRWPIVWMADQVDRTFFRDNLAQPGTPYSAITRNEQVMATKVLRALDSIITFISTQ